MGDWHHPHDAEIVEAVESCTFANLINPECNVNANPLCHISKFIALTLEKVYHVTDKNTEQ